MQEALVSCNGTGISIMGEGSTKMTEGGGVETAGPSKSCAICSGCISARVVLSSVCRDESSLCRL